MANVLVSLHWESLRWVNPIQRSGILLGQSNSPEPKPPYFIEGGRIAVDGDRLQRGIEDRQKELHHAADIIASSAQRLRRASALSKVVIIILGAIAATSGAATQIAGEKSVSVTIIYTAVGLLIATVGGIEAAFKFGDRGAELTTLAATCQSTLREIDSRWKKEVGSTVDPTAQEEAKKALLDTQDQKLNEIQENAAKLNVNITLKLRELEDAPSLPA